MRTSIAKTSLRLLGVSVAMFGFGFALVPLYDVFCEVTGLNGKTSNQAYESVGADVDRSRTIKVQFLTTNNDGMAWQFKPTIRELRVHPGELAETEFFAKNPSASAMVAQAVPSLVPFNAAEFFHKTECFCFTQQTLAGGQEIMMPLRFIVDQDIPKDVHTITLAYTLFDVTSKASPRVAQAN